MNLTNFYTNLSDNLYTILTGALHGRDFGEQNEKLFKYKILLK